MEIEIVHGSIKERLDFFLKGMVMIAANTS
jgi:hypothetical protein